MDFVVTIIGLIHVTCSLHYLRKVVNDIFFAFSDVEPVLARLGQHSQANYTENFISLYWLKFFLKTKLLMVVVKEMSP